MSTYHALYRIAGHYFWRPFQADDLQHAVEQAVDAAEEEEELQSVIRIA